MKINLKNTHTFLLKYMNKNNSNIDFLPILSDNDKIYLQKKNEDKNPMCEL